MQLTCTLWLLDALASEKEHTQHREQRLAQWCIPRCCHLAWGSYQPLSWEPAEDDINICSLPSCDDESFDYA